MEYKGFSIIQDKQLGLSCLEPSGKWMCSVSKEEEAKKIIDAILDSRELILKNWEQGIEINPATQFYIKKGISDSEIRDMSIQVAFRSKLIAFKNDKQITASAGFDVDELSINYKEFDL